jgi:hypothetical protein
MFDDVLHETCQTEQARQSAFPVPRLIKREAFNDDSSGSTETPNAASSEARPADGTQQHRVSVVLGTTLGSLYPDGASRSSSLITSRYKLRS